MQAKLTSQSTRLSDVADRAGVAKSIASRVLNGTRVTVRPETRERVLQAAQELGYQPNPAARALNRSKTRSVSMLIPDLANSAYSRIVRGTVQRASQLDYSLLIAEDNTEETASVQRLVRSHLIDGLIVASARPRHPLVPFLLEIGFPHVFALRAVPGSRRNVTIDDERVSMVAYDHLHSLGHVRIGQVAGPKSIDSARRRAAGFRKRAQEYGLPVPAVAHGRFSEQSGAEAARSLLETDPTITGIFTQSLTQGVGALYAIQRMGFSIPEQVSVISYDDMPLAEFLQPSLTTVRVPLEALGVAAFDALSAQLDGQPSEDVVVPTEPTVIVRESTAAAP